MKRAKKFRALVCGLSALGLLWWANCGGGNGGSTPPPPQNNPVPSISTVSPASAAAGGPSFTLTVNGSGFISTSSVEWNGSSRSTSFVSSTQLTAAITANDIATQGTASITVVNPSPGGGTSNAVSFTIGNPVPVLSSLSPASATVRQASFPLTATGTNFVSSSVIRWNNTALATTFNSSTQLTATVPAANVASVGTAQISVFTPTPGGGTSNTISFLITNPTPVKILTTVLPPTGGNKSYYFMLSSSGGASPYTWSLASGSLPSGLTVDAGSGLISGTVSPSAAGSSYPFTVRIQDSLSPPQSFSQSLRIDVMVNLPRNDNPPPCGSGSDVATAISNGRLRASISPFGDVDVYSFHGTANSQVVIETFAQRLNLFNDGARDSYMDSVLELLDSNCNQIAVNDDINPGVIQDSLLQGTLPSTGTYYIRVRDLRGDGRPDLIYELSLSGAD